MEISVLKQTSINQKGESHYYPILKYTFLNSSNSLLLVSEGKMHDGDIAMNFHEIFKVQFLATCKIEIADCVLIAFYLGERGELYPYIISGLPNNYYQDGESFFLIDYKSYLEICEFSGETKLSLVEYIKDVKAGNLGPNTLLEHNNELLNRDQQNEFYKANPPQD